MMVRWKLTGLFCLAMLSMFMLTANVSAGWEEDQEALFSQIPVKPGDIIDSSNYEKVKDLLFPSVVDWVKKGDFILKIGELNWAYQQDDAWLAASEKNDGKYSIDADGALIDVASAKRAEYVYGDPFPNIDWKNDPNAGIKLVYNAVLHKSRSGNYDNPWVIDWVGRKGLERYISGNTYQSYYWGVKPEPNNPGKFLANMLVTVSEPYDVAGTTQLTQRLYTEKFDQCYAYVPSIRRVKKVSGATRSSPFMGTDLTNDDGQAFDGKPETMNWKIIDRKIMLMPVSKHTAAGPIQFKEQPDGSWASPANLRGPVIGHEVKDWKGAPWAPTDLVYVPRMMYIMEATAKDRYYNYGRQIFAFDPVPGFIWKEIYNRADEYWKTLFVTWYGANFKDHTIFACPDYYLIVDAKSDHASSSNCFGLNYTGKVIVVKYSDPKLKPSLFSPTSMTALSK